MPEITKRLGEYEKNLAEGKKRIHDFEEASAQYEEAALALEQLKKEKAEQEKKRQLAEKRLQEGQDDWISLLYEKADRAWSGNRKGAFSEKRKNWPGHTNPFPMRERFRSFCAATMRNSGWSF